MKNLDEENAWQRMVHMSYLYISFVCFWVSLGVGLLVSIATGGLTDEYRRSHPVKMFKTFFPTSWYCPALSDDYKLNEQEQELLYAKQATSKFDAPEI